MQIEKGPPHNPNSPTGGEKLFVAENKSIL